MTHFNDLTDFVNNLYKDAILEEMGSGLVINKNRKEWKPPTAEELETRRLQDIEDRKQLDLFLAEFIALMKRHPGVYFSSYEEIDVCYKHQMEDLNELSSKWEVENE